MAVLLSPVGGAAAQFLDNNGNPLSGGKLYTYTAGTTTPQAVYTTASGAVPHTNPIVLDGGGRVPSGEIWLTDGFQYKFVLKTSTDVLIGTYDNLIGINSNFVNFLTQTEIQTATAGQTVFTLATTQYQPGSNNLSVFVDGVNQYDGVSYSYVETSSTVVTFTVGLHVGALVKFTTAQTLSTGVTDSSLVTYQPAGTGAVATTVQTKLRETVSVKDFGAVGDGVTDDTAALNVAANALQDGQSLYFPAGTYLANTGCVRFNTKSNITVYGDGSASIIKQSNQGVSASRVPWHSTMMFDKCADITVSNLVIEGKGSQYGDIPGSKPATPDLCATSIETEFGVALAVTRCTGTVYVQNVIARYPGDNSAFYYSACYRVVTENCFSNCASFSYAGFNADNWCDSSIGGRRYEFYNCRVATEQNVPAGLSTTYSSKSGVVFEGDNTKPLEALIEGGFIRDTAIGADAPTYGAAVIATDCNLTMSGVKVRNCYGGARLNKRGGVTDLLTMVVTGNDIRDCKVYGIYTAIGSSTGGNYFSIQNNYIDVNATSVWSALANTSVEFSTGVVHDGFMSGTITVAGNRITGPQLGVWGLDQSQFTILNNYLVASSKGIALNGAGTNYINSNTISTTGVASIPVYVSTLNYAATSSRNAYTYLNSNTLIAQADTTIDSAFQLTGNSALFVETQVKNNSVPKGVLNFVRGSATLFDVDWPLLQTTQRIVANGLSGANTYIEVQMPKEYLPVFSYAVGTDEVSRAVISQTNNSGGVRGLIRLVMTGDVRTFYTAANNVRVTVMQ